MTPTRVSSNKQPYSKPKVTEYGDLARITKTASMTATLMDGGPNNTKSNWATRTLFGWIEFCHLSAY